MPATLLAAWIMAIAGVEPPGLQDDDDFVTSSMRWMMLMPAGFLMVASGLMHTVFARSTASNIGWTTNGFQYELGFVSLGLGAAGITATFLDRSAWLVLSIAVTTFLVGAAGLHVKEILVARNFALGNTWILIYDFGLPMSLLGLLAVGAGSG